jgi:hypothetical protein
VVVEFLAILSFFSKLKLQNKCGSHAATWRQKVAAVFPSFVTDAQLLFVPRKEATRKAIVKELGLSK